MKILILLGIVTVWNGKSYLLFLEIQHFKHVGTIYQLNSEGINGDNRMLVKKRDFWFEGKKIREEFYNQDEELLEIHLFQWSTNGEKLLQRSVYNHKVLLENAVEYYLGFVIECDYTEEDFSENKIEYDNSNASIISYFDGNMKVKEIAFPHFTPHQYLSYYIYNSQNEIIQELVWTVKLNEKREFIENRLSHKIYYKKYMNKYVLEFKNPANTQFKWKVTGGCTENASINIEILENFESVDIFEEIIHYVYNNLKEIKHIDIETNWYLHGNWASEEVLKQFYDGTVEKKYGFTVSI